MKILSRFSLCWRLLEDVLPWVRNLKNFLSRIYWRNATSHPHIWFFYCLTREAQHYSVNKPKGSLIAWKYHANIGILLVLPPVVDRSEGNDGRIQGYSKTLPSPLPPQRGWPRLGKCSSSKRVSRGFCWIGSFNETCRTGDQTMRYTRIL